MIKITRTESYRKNADKVRGEDYPCVVCGKAVKRGRRAHQVHVGSGGGYLLLESEVNMSADDYCGVHPLGRDCLTNNPDLKPYVIQE